MKRKYNVSGADRKRLVKVIDETLGITPKYMGTPSFGYQIGGYEVGMHGTLTFKQDEQTASVLIAIDAAGFTVEQDAEETPIESTEGHTEASEEIPQATETAETEPDIVNLSISMPRETFTTTTLENLDTLLDSKGKLIKAAFGIESTEYTLTEERITFAWFHGALTPEAYRAYADLSANCAKWLGGRSVCLPRRGKWKIPSMPSAVSCFDSA